MRRYLLYSLGFHVGFILLMSLAYMTFSFKPPLKNEIPLYVEFAQVGPKRASPKPPSPQPSVQKKLDSPQAPPKKPLAAPSKDPSPPLKKASPPSESPPPKPSPTPENKAEKLTPEKLTPSSSKSENKAEPKPAPKMEEKVPLPSLKPSSRPKELMKEPPASSIRPASRPKAQKNLRKTSSDKVHSDFTNLIKELENEAPNAPTDAGFEEQAAQLTMSEIDAVRQKIRQCWIVPDGAVGAKDLIVEIEMTIAPDGTVTEARITDQKRAQQDPYYKSASESALRAVRDPYCNPLPLPKDKYKEWKNLTLVFNPQDMF